MNGPDKLKPGVPATPVAQFPPTARSLTGPMYVLRLWFGLTLAVGPLAYRASGITLMVFKYTSEVAFIQLCTGKFFTPTQFLLPLISIRQGLLGPEMEWLGWVQFAWTIPFLWIVVSMSIRRAADAGQSPWLGLLVLFPLVNYFVMVIFSFVPTAKRTGWLREPQPVALEPQVKSGTLAVLASTVIFMLMVVVGVLGLKSYGASLFMGTPVVMGAVSGYVHNRRHPRSLASTMGIALLSAVLPAFVLLLFALEGVICIMMALPLVVPLTLFGGLVGKAIADCTSRPAIEVLAVVLVLPFLGAAESVARRSPMREVMTAVEINATPAVVWSRVTSFPPLDPPREWYFRTGIAYPTAARIDGSGVGAVRHCDFSTGSFTEPVTTWDPPHRLAFDVTEQPKPMRELSPYRQVHAPHLDGGMRSRRGEFRLIELPGGRTRLEGRTWYELDMWPQAYWTVWSDAVVRRIHSRVLEHVRRLCEVTTDSDRVAPPVESKKGHSENGRTVRREAPDETNGTGHRAGL